MKKRAPIIISILICLAVIGISYYWVTALMDSTYAYRSPLRNSAPKPGEAVGIPNTRSLVIVLIDALRYDTSLDTNVMPFLNDLRSRGAYALMHSRPPSYSMPTYTVLLTGAWPEISDGPVINHNYDDTPTFTQDNIFSASHRANLSTAVSGFNWFEKLIPQEAVSISFYTPGEDQEADRQVTDAALPWLQEGNYHLVLIHLDQVDYAGDHEGGPMDPDWDAAATRVDGLIKEIASAMDINQDTLLIISDHGQIDQGGHGGQDSIVLQEPFILVGNGVIPGKYNDIQMVDVAPTVAAILGTNIPATNQGRPLVEMYDFTLTQVEDINNALSKQLGQLATAYEIAIGTPVSVERAGEIASATQEGMEAARESRLNNQRIIRGIFAIVFLILIINLTTWHAKPHVSWILGGVATYLVLFTVKYNFIDHKTYSLSSVISADNLIVTTALTTFIALAVAWFLVLIGTRSYRFTPRQAADTTLKFILVILSILAIPILIHFAVNGATVTWALPNFLLSFLGLLFLIQTLMVSVIGLILTSLSALVGAFGRDN